MIPPSGHVLHEAPVGLTAARVRATRSPPRDQVGRTVALAATIQGAAPLRHRSSFMREAASVRRCFRRDRAVSSRRRGRPLRWCFSFATCPLRLSDDPRGSLAARAADSAAWLGRDDHPQGRDTLRSTRGHAWPKTAARIGRSCNGPSPRRETPWPSAGSVTDLPSRWHSPVRDCIASLRSGHSWVDISTWRAQNSQP